MIRLECRHKASTEIKGRLGCIAVLNNGKVVLVQEVGKPVAIYVDTDKFETVRSLAVKGKGSLYVELHRTGAGYIMDGEE